MRNRTALTVRNSAESENKLKTGMLFSIKHLLFQQARSRDLPRYDTTTTNINGRSSTVGETSCCSKLS